MTVSWAAPVVGRWIVAAALLLVAAGPVLAQQGDNEYSRLLGGYTMENLGYGGDERTIEREKEVARAWVGNAEAMMQGANRRKEAARAAREIKKRKVEALKERKSQAGHAHNEAEKKGLERQIKSEEAAQRILERIEKMAELDRAFGRAWKDAGESFRKSLDARLDVARLPRPWLSRREAARATSGRYLDARTYDAYRKEAESSEVSAKKLRKMAEEMEKRAQERKRFLEDLKEGGYTAAR